MQSQEMVSDLNFVLGVIDHVISNHVTSNHVTSNQVMGI